jgi:TPR repeat protein
VPQDYAEALKLFRRGAEQVYASSQKNLGLMYEKGWSVPQDYAEAAKWYRKAAERGYGPAQNLLAMLEAQGKGLAKDSVEAAKWFVLADAHGNKEGDEIRQANMKEMRPEQITEAKKRVAEFIPKD